MDPLIGIHCYLCNVATTRTPRNGRIRNGWIFFDTGSDKKQFQCSLTSDGLILYTRANQGHSGRAKVDPTSLDNVAKFRTKGLSTSVTLVVPASRTPSLKRD